MKQTATHWLRGRIPRTGGELLPGESAILPLPDHGALLGPPDDANIDHSQGIALLGAGRHMIGRAWRQLVRYSEAHQVLHDAEGARFGAAVQTERINGEVGQKVGEARVDLVPGAARGEEDAEGCEGSFSQGKDWGWGLEGFSKMW